MLCSASRRLVGATDARVVGIAPIVMPILDMVSNLNHQWKACTLTLCAINNLYFI